MSDNNSPMILNRSEAALAPWTEGAKYNQLKSLASVFASSQMVPKKFQGKPMDCFIALQLADRAGIDPFLVLQNLNIVEGQPGWKTTFAMELAVTRGFFEDPIEFTITGSGDTLRVVASAVLAKSGRKVEAHADWKMAEIEGWTRNSKYKSMPEQMLCYRAATFLIRRNAPGVLAGMPVTEENEDLRDVTPQIAAGESSVTRSINEKIAQAKAETK